MLNIVLVEPEIPNNTGNIGRLCVGTESRLHLIKPYGFEITDKNLKRSGLDYWVHLDWHEYDNVAQWMAQVNDKSRVFLMSSHAVQSIYDTEFQDGDWLVFGKESVGLSPEVLALFSNHLTIPMSQLIRSYNLANSVAFVIGEAKRQISLK
ncbi:MULTISPECIES: tRNA (cytidine(34)-2'-O)-methyltransferase [Flavobacterium]|uniref:Putative tRNA (cytidine(34)-2'-O)-methyltransferase n=1 Tax=Flavobacterium sedimenticola TaxID=3043286 RepID=A0ABT6XNI0_9FLAO|nr:tRNA (cytidine(34)-2'-O)-methyltransferase [Flavobacterium sedimenticola]MDI9256647.1 tRNA (cytidine(34)-2'-O)-methyltransferase [Flavobacterium sedimenticola]